jgi:hypothetical protein
MLKASNAKPEAWESWKVKIERRRCGTAFSKRETQYGFKGDAIARTTTLQAPLGAPAG